MREIILNETSKAAKLLSDEARVGDVKVAISLLMRYDVQAAKIEPDAAARHVRQAVRSMYPAVNQARIDRLVDHYAAHATDCPLSNINGVPITQSEMDVVLGRDGIRAKCLTFALLALAKFDTMRCPGIDYWYNGERLAELVRRADLVLNDDELCYTLHGLYQDGYIGLSERVDNCSLHVLFAETDGDPVMMLNEQDYKNLGYCLRAYLGGGYKRCEECGCWIKQNGRGQPRKFCQDCAATSCRDSKSAYMRRIRTATF